MDVIIGRYRAFAEESRLFLVYGGIKFDLTPEEALELMNFIFARKQTLIAIEQEHDNERNTDPQIERVTFMKKARKGE